MIDVAKKLLKEHGLKTTPQRLYVLTYFLHHKSHPTIEELYQEMIKSIPSISKTTIYNVLEDLAQVHLLERLPSPDGKMRYDLRLKQHHHLIDLDHNTVIDYEDEELSNFLREYFDKKKIQGFEVKSCHVEIFVQAKNVKP